MTDPAPRLAQARRLLTAGQAQQALAEAQLALRNAPGHPDAHNAMAIILMSLGQKDQSLYHSEHAAQARPTDPQLALNLGIHLIAADRRADAIPWVLRAIELAPGNPTAEQTLINLLRSRGLFGAALSHLEASQRRHPDNPTLAGLYAATLTNTARVPESAAFLRQWLHGREDLRLALAYANAMTYCPDVSPAEVFAAHQAFARLVEKTMPRGFTEYPNEPDPDRTLRIGVLSAELRQHAVATFIEPWLQHHDPSRLHITCYTVSPKVDDTTARLRSAAQAWVEAAAMTPPQLTDRIKADRIDILVETTGLNQGHRMGVMWMKPAPISVTMVGYLNTTGLSRIDYRIVDAHTDPPGAEAFSAERLIRLDPTYWCYHPPDGAPDIPGRDPGPITFGSFNSTGKLNDRVIALWTRLVNSVPDSRLLLKSFDFADAILRDAIAARFERAGLDRARLQIEGPTLGANAFYSCYLPVDIALDPFPFSGTTTTLDALWMGVPVITLAGRMHAGRTGVSILSTLGLPELIARDEADYLRIAADLATDAPRLADLRRTLRPRLAASPLCDAPGFARRMDTALRTMWQQWCASRPAPPR